MRLDPYARTLGLLALLLTAYGTTVATGAREAFPTAMAGQGPMPRLMDKPVGEDGFYMLSAAWNLGHGRGLSYARGEPTTGVQPLATLLYAGLARATSALGGSRWTFVRVVIVAGTLTAVLLAFVLGGLARSALPDSAPPDLRARVGFLATALALGDFWIFRTATYGLETGLYLVLVAAFVRCLVGVAERPAWRGVAVVGGLAGLCGLARVDFGVLLAVVLGVLVVRRRMSLGHGVAIGGIALALVAPWFVYVHDATGAWLPSSGPAQASGLSLGNASVRLVALGVAVVEHAAPWAFVGVTRSAAVALSLASSVAVGAWLVSRRRTIRATVRPRPAWTDVMAALAAGVAVLAVVYVSAFHAWYFYARYLAPAAVLVVPGLALLLGRAAPEWTGRWTPARAAPLAAAVLGAGFAVYAGLSLHTGRIAHTQAVAAGIVASDYAGRRVGAFQSGIVGYVHPDIVNLDGKVDPRALAAARAGRLDAYVDSSGVDVLLDWPLVLAALDPAVLATRWRPCRPPPDGFTLCYERR